MLKFVAISTPYEWDGKWRASILQYFEEKVVTLDLLILLYAKAIRNEKSRITWKLNVRKSGIRSKNFRNEKEEAQYVSYSDGSRMRKQEYQQLF